MTINTSSTRAILLVLAVCAAATLHAQAPTPIKLAKNKYTPEQDAKLGLEAAAEVRKQYPVITDERITRYLSGLGDKLVEVAPAEFKNPAYKYSFTPVNVKEINAFALPGGPMFVNRGMFDAAAQEGEVVGVMAHELSHVLLRHGTANMTKASNPWLQIGQMAGMVGGAVLGGAAGSAIAQGTQLGLAGIVTKYSRDFEKQADILGAQIMARAGYDPRGLAHMFETIEKQSGGGGGNPEWLSSHPNPGNRSQYITKEAAALTLGPAADTSQFAPIKTAFASQPPAKSMADIEKSGNAARAAAPGADAPAASVGTPGQPVARPSAEFRSVKGGNVFQASVPSDWTTLPSKTAMKVVPQNGYGELNGQAAFVYGVEFGVASAASRDLAEATKAWLNAVAQNNPDMRLAGNPQQTQISGRTAIAVSLVNPSALGGQERIGVYTTFLAEGTLFYYLTIVPEKDAEAFRETFQRVGASIQLATVR